jgi:hypothetical protein
LSFSDPLWVLLLWLRLGSSLFIDKWFADHSVHCSRLDTAQKIKVIKPDTIAKFTQYFKAAQLFTGPCENNKKISNAPNIILIFSKM